VIDPTGKERRVFRGDPEHQSNDMFLTHDCGDGVCQLIDRGWLRCLLRKTAGRNGYTKEEDQEFAINGHGQVILS
jgi:hypothetical protein